MKKNRLKILVPIFQFGRAGGYRVISKLADNWKKQGHEVDFVCYFESDIPYYPSNANIIWIGNKGESKLANTNCRSKFGLIKRIYSLYRYIRIHGEKYDVVLANYNITSIPVCMASKKRQFYYIQAYEPEFYSNKSIHQILLKYISWITYFLPLHKIVNAEIYKNYNNLKCKYVIPPGLDLDTYYSRCTKNKEYLVVGCIGRQEEWKGANDVGEAVRILHEKGLNIKLKVAFNPVKYERHELVQPHGDENLADYYRSLDVLVAPGHIQLGAIHYPVIEAMACNVPVITTGYYPANKENSFIVPIKSPKEIAKVIESIYNDYSSAIAKAERAKQHILQFDWSIVSDKFINIFYEEIEGGKK